MSRFAVPGRPQTLREALSPATTPPPRSAFTPAERRLVARLRTPAAVQQWLNELPYNTEVGGETLRTFRGVVQRGTAHCLEAALFAAVTLEQHGYPPLLLSFESVDRLDHVTAHELLRSDPRLDLERVGVMGRSYGGYMTLMALARAPEVFAAGVAGAPVTHWDGYDTGYTERYMSTPQGNPEGYRVSSVMAHVEGVRAPLLIVHGMIDENVHFRHTARLMVALAAAQKPYELLAYPEERHMPRDAKGLEYQERRVLEFLERALAE